MSLRVKTDFGDQKKVRWAFNLEQIVYFYPDLEQQECESKAAKHVKITKAKIIKACNRDIVDWLQEKAEYVMAKLIPGHSGQVNFEDLLTDINEHWNECFEHYGKYKAIESDSIAKY